MSTTVKLPDDLMNQLDTFDKHTDEIIEKALTAGAKIAEAQVRKNLKAVLSGDSSGQLESALGVSPMDISNGTLAPNVRVGFAEPRQDKNGKTTYTHKFKAKKGKPPRTSEYQLTNAMVANILEYGSKKHNQSPKPFMKPALDATKAASKDEIKRVFDEEANKYLKTKG